MTAGPGAGRGWPVEEIADTPARLHARDLAGPARAVTVCRATSAALVVGSAQPAGTVDAGRAAARGVDVVRRRSGGGAVLVVPGDLLWVDVTVPSGDPFWERDITVAARRLGRAWARAAGAVGVPEAAAHEGGMVRTEWSARLCFAGLGPGEVTCGGRKLVGISQRRTRLGATFQCALLLTGDQAEAAELLAAPAAERRRAAREVRAGSLSMAQLGLSLSTEAVVSALVDRLV